MFTEEKPVRYQARAEYIQMKNQRKVLSEKCFQFVKKELKQRIKSLSDGGRLLLQFDL